MITQQIISSELEVLKNILTQEILEFRHYGRD